MRGPMQEAKSDTPVMLFIIVMIGCMLVALTHCHLTPDASHRDTSGYLRGDLVFSLAFPLQQGRQEWLGYGKEPLVTRAFEPFTVQTIQNRMVIPNRLWQDLAVLRGQWCEHPPIPASHTPKDSEYILIFQCGQVQNPVYAVPPAALPPAIQHLITLVPSTDERLVGPP